MTITGLLASEFGWRSTFYVFGSLCILWSFFYMFLCYNTPSQHPRISQVLSRVYFEIKPIIAFLCQEEKTYIEYHLDGVVKSTDKKLPHPPILKILTSIPFYALLITHIGNHWGIYTLLSEAPTYLNNIQHIPLKSVSWIKISINK